MEGGLPFELTVEVDVTRVGLGLVLVAIQVDDLDVEVDELGLVVALPFPFEFVVDLPFEFVVELPAEEGELFIPNPVRLSPPSELLDETWRVRRRVAGGEGREVVRLRD